MKRLGICLVAAMLAAGAAGCCASPYRMWQNARGWNDPHIDCYHTGPAFPKTTPPGPTFPAAVKVTPAVAGP